MVTADAWGFYRALVDEAASRKVIEEFHIAAETGRAFLVNEGQILRVSVPEGPQVADINAFSRADPKEMFWAGQTRVLERAHLTVGNQLWSTAPRSRPMLTIIRDTVEHRPLPNGAASHDCLLHRCNRRLFEVRDGESNRRNCQANLETAIAPFGLPPDSVHDAFNVFMVTGIDQHDRLFYREPDCRRGDFVELYAELDCIVAISACPGKCNGERNLPIGIGVYQAT